MLGQAIDLLNQLGILGSLQFIAVSIAAIFVYRYFTDKA